MTRSAQFRVLLVYANSPMDNLMPVSISSLAGALLRRGFDVKLFDTTFYPWTTKAGGERQGSLQVAEFDYGKVGIKFAETDVFEDFRSIVKEYKPDLVALSTVEPTHAFGVELLKTIRGSSIPTIVGGVFTIFSPEDVIREDAVDMVCTGEGESALSELCIKMSAGEDYTAIPNLWVKQAGRIYKNRQLVENVEELPMLDFSLFDEKRFYRPMAGRIYRMLPVEFSRGCVYTCAYCSAPSYADKFKSAGRWLRYKSTDKIFAEIEHYVNAYDVEYFYFVSETFLAMPDEKFKEFCDRYRKIRVPFWLNTRSETITEKKVDMLEDIGCHRMSVGIECGNPEYSRSVLKRILNKEQIVRACDLVSKSSIQLSVNNMIGFPDETRDMIFDTIKLNRDIRANSYTCSIFQPYRGTKLYDRCVEKGYIDPLKLCFDPNYCSPLRQPHITDSEIRGIYRTFPLYVKFPVDNFQDIRKAERFDEDGDKIFNELSVAYRQKYEKK